MLQGRPRRGDALRSVAGAVVVHTLAPAAWPLLEVLALLPVLHQQRPPLPQALQPLDAILRRHSGAVLAVAVAKALLEKLLPDAARTVRMWRMFLPIWARCRWTKWRAQEAKGCSKAQVAAAWEARHEREGAAVYEMLLDLGVAAAWEARHEREGAAVYEMLLDLGGMYVKSAQILASKGDFVPEPWTRRLAVMFDSMPPKPWPAMRKALLADLARSPAGRLRGAQGSPLMMESFLESVEEQPLASASIAQVHGGVLSKGVTAELGWCHGRAVVLKVQKGDMRGPMEADVRNLRRLAAFVGDTLPFSPLPMLEEMAANVPKEFDFAREALLMRVIGARLAASGVRGVAVPEPLPALSSRALLVMQRMPGVPLSRILEGSIDGALRARLRTAMASLLDAFGCSMLRWGLYNADPHAGNLLLQEDGTLALLDFGQVQALSAQRQRALARLVIALDDGWPAGVVAAMKGMGLDFLSRAGGVADPLLITIVANIIFDVRPLPEALICPLADDATIKAIPLRHFPADLFLVGRSIMILRGLVHALGLDLQASRIWRPHALAALRDPDLDARAGYNARCDDGIVPPSACT